MRGINQVSKTTPPSMPGARPSKKTIFDQFPDPRGVKIEKTPLENVFITYLGINNEILDITLTQKKIDEEGNTYYLELITKNKYTDSNQDNIHVLKINTLFSILNQILDIDLKTIIKNGYLTKDNIIDLHDYLNKDQFYQTKYYSRGDGPVYYDCPSFLERYKNQNCIMEQEDENLSNLVIKLLTEDKIPIINGEHGIGKSTLVNKLNYFLKHEKNRFTNKEVWKIDYNDLIENILTPKHLKDRIKNTFSFLKEQPNSILFIDNVNLKDETFIDSIKKYQDKSKTMLVLISNEKINEDDIDKDSFSIINVSLQKDETLKQILKNKINELKEITEMKLNLNNDEENELISILLNSNKTNSLNDNYDKHPILAIKILENAFTAATAYRQGEVHLYNFYYALSLKNINLPKDSIGRTIQAIDELSTKVEARKQQERQKKPMKEKIKNFFIKK